MFCLPKTPSVDCSFMSWRTGIGSCSFGVPGLIEGVREEETCCQLGHGETQQRGSGSLGLNLNNIARLRFKPKLRLAGPEFSFSVPEMVMTC